VLLTNPLVSGVVDDTEWISLLDVLQKESFSLMLWISQIFDTESN